MSLLSRVHSVFGRDVSTAALQVVIDHLERFGYIEEGDLDDLNDVSVRDLVVAAVGKMAAHAGVHLTGVWVIDLIVLYRFIHRNPRCSLTEKIEELPEAATARWTKKNLTFYVDGTVRSVERQQFRTAMGLYFKNWEAVCDLKFTEVDQSNSDILVSKGRGSAQQFDGAGGTLAWSYLPNGDDRQILMRFDDDENFSTNKEDSNKIYLEAVATHELGHAIGLSHAPGSSSLLSPYYNAKIFKPQAWDVAEAQKRYGPPTTKPPATPPVPPQPPAQPPAIPSNFIDVNGIVVPGYRLVKVSS